MNNTTNTETSSTHPFTARGLGQAPFRYIGEKRQNIAYGQAVVGSLGNGAEITTKPGGTCAYCGTYIVNMFNVESADGNKFHVGSDCVAKIASADPELASVVDQAVTTARRVQTEARNAAKISALRAQLAQPEVRAALASKPHPRGFKGQTLLNSVEWMMQHSGTAGRLATAKVVALALAPAGSCPYCGKPEACTAEKPCRALRAVWAREERRVQRCENEEARRFEDRAYGRD
jgi:hypothetical protein